MIQSNCYLLIVFQILYGICSILNIICSIVFSKDASKNIIYRYLTLKTASDALTVGILIAIYQLEILMLYESFCVYMIRCFNAISSILSIIVAIERYICMRKSVTRKNDKYFSLWIAAAILFSFVYNAPIMFGTNKKIVLILQSALSTSTTALLFSLSFLIIYHIQSKPNRRNSLGARRMSISASKDLINRNHRMSIVAATSNGTLTSDQLAIHLNQLQRVSLNKNNNPERKTILMIIISLLIFLVYQIELFIDFYLYCYLNDYRRHFLVVSILNYSFSLINFGSNFFIYYLFNSRFTYYLKEIFKFNSLGTRMANNELF